MVIFDPCKPLAWRAVALRISQYVRTFKLLVPTVIHKYRERDLQRLYRMIRHHLHEPIRGETMWLPDERVDKLASELGPSCAGWNHFVWVYSIMQDEVQCWVMD
jgi:hypothetical protein